MKMYKGIKWKKENKKHKVEMNVYENEKTRNKYKTKKMQKDKYDRTK